MGRLLERLLSDAESATAATLATLATIPDPSARKVAESQESRGGSIEKAKAQRARLLALAADQLLAAGLVHGLDDADVSACDELSDVELLAYLHALDATGWMDKGIAPPAWGTLQARTCEGCGPVLLWSSCLDVVTACPWCARRKTGLSIPRPRVTCADCQHFLPDSTNPSAGGGSCALSLGRATWPMQQHRCVEWSETSPRSQHV